MATDFSAIINDFNVALASVARKPAGLISAVTRDSRVDSVNKGQSVQVPIPSPGTIRDITPSLSNPSETSSTQATVPVELEYFKASPFDITAEDDRVLEMSGVGLTVRQQKIITAISTITDEIAKTGYEHVAKNMARAYGAAATPILTGTDLMDLTKTGQILKENGAPPGHAIVLGTDAVANLAGKYWKANEMGSTEAQREGWIGRLGGFDIYEDAAVTSVAAGTGASYVLDGALLKGATVIKVKTGTGTIIAGDIITVGNHKYVVKTALDGTSKLLEIHGPGLVAGASDGANVSVSAASTRCPAFYRGSTLLAARQPANTPNAVSIVIQDPVTKLHFELNSIDGYRMTQFEVALAWGWKTIQPQFGALLQY